MSAALEVRDLACQVQRGGAWVDAVRGVSFAIARGTTLGLVGESGCGKTLTALAVLGLLPEGARHRGGTVALGGRVLEGAELARARGRELAMVFQEPQSALDPTMRVGDQIAEGLVRLGGLPRAVAAERAVALLREMGVPDPEARARQWPHQLSGGMRQRALMAAALAVGPQVLVADEPTTALDVTVQAQLLALLRRLVQERSLAVLLITHDLGVVAELCDEVAVLYAGRVVEQGPTAAVFEAPAHPYLQALLAARPHPARRGAPLQAPGGSVPAPGEVPVGCAYRDRCARAVERCGAEVPLLQARPEPAHRVACHLPGAGP